MKYSKSQGGGYRLISEQMMADQDIGLAALVKAKTQLLVMCGNLFLPRPRLHGPPRGRQTMDGGEEVNAGERHSDFRRFRTSEQQELH